MKRLLIIDHCLIYKYVPPSPQVPERQQDMRQRRRAVDALVSVDNVHAVSGRDGFSRTFFNTCATVDA